MLASELVNPSPANDLNSTSSSISYQSNMGRLHELLKDPMLEKLVLLVVSLFSVATEMRLEQRSNQFSSVVSEPWHAQSVIYAAYYLPKECPLVAHLVDTYFKHYQPYHILALTKPTSID